MKKNFFVLLLTLTVFTQGQAVAQYADLDSSTVASMIEAEKARIIESVRSYMETQYPTLARELSPSDPEFQRLVDSPRRQARSGFTHLWYGQNGSTLEKSLKRGIEKMVHGDDPKYIYEASERANGERREIPFFWSIEFVDEVLTENGLGESQDWQEGTAIIRTAEQDPYTQEDLERDWGLRN